MLPERLNFLREFDNFYKELVNSVKEDIIQERDFYIIIKNKCKAMDQERRERIIKLNNLAN